MPELSPLAHSRSWIEAALERSGTHSFEDIEAGVTSGLFQLWPAPEGCLVTELVQYPQKKVINVFLGGGKLEQLEVMHRDVIAWAKAQGCTGAEINGRAGWVRTFQKHGWKEKSRTLTLEYDEWAAS